MSRIAIIVATLSLLLAGCARRDAPPPADVTASVLASRATVAPGATVEIGWRFDLAPGWHLYADLRNDTGLPPRVALDLPPGWEASALRWPAGRRLVSPGGILDHVYEDRVTLLQTLRAPADAVPGETVELSARVEWLACREGCVPGDTTLVLKLPVAAAAAPSEQAEELAHLERELPRPPRPDEVASSWNGATLRLEVPGAERLEFHPAADAGTLRDALADAAADGPSLDLRFRPRDGRVGPARGILLAFTGDDVRPLSLDFPAAPAAEPTEGEPR